MRWLSTWALILLLIMGASAAAGEWAMDTGDLVYFDTTPTPYMNISTEDGQIIVEYTTTEKWTYTFKVVLELPPDGKLPPNPELRLEFIKLEKED